MQSAARTRTKRWLIHPPDDRCAPLARSLKISPLLAQLLINRGLTDTDAASIFLRPKLVQLIQPEMMPGIEPAVKRIAQAMKDGQKITIYGDYDVDGITGLSILFQLLKFLFSFFSHIFNPIYHIIRVLKYGIG